MLKNLLYLYNDGHNPFPHMKGGMIGEEDSEEESEEETNEEALARILLEDAFNERLRELHEDTVSKKEFEDKLKDPDFIYDIKKSKEFHDLEVLAKEMYPEYEYQGYYDDEELERLEVEKHKDDMNLLKVRESHHLNNEPLEKHKGDMDKLILMEKELKKNTIRNNLELNTLKKTINAECLEIGGTALKNSVSGDIKKFSILNNILGTVSTNILKIIQSKHTDEEEEELILKEISKVIKVSKVNETNALYIIYAYLEKTKGDDKSHNVIIDNIHDILLSLKPFDKYTKILLPLLKKNHENDKKLNEITEQKKKLKMKLEVIDITKDDIKESQQKYRDIKENYDKKRNTRKEEIKEIIKTYKFNPKEALQQIEKLEDEIEYDLNKLKAKTPTKPETQKAVSKTSEEKQNEIDEARVNGRLETINGMSGDGKKLETYFTKQGQDVLHYITDDNTPVHDNEYNERIPNFDVLLSTGEMGSLRKAVTLDLYSDDTVYEIKNYKDYNSKDPVPVQVTKLQGTGYFEHLYLPNGRLYNIKFKG